jgi:hypothetical protein
MLYDIQNYWVFGLCPPSEIVNIRKHKVSEIKIVSDLRSNY